MGGRQLRRALHEYFVQENGKGGVRCKRNLVGTEQSIVRMNCVDRFACYLRQEKRCSPLTESSYLRDVDLFLSFLGTDRERFEPEHVDTEDVHEWIAALGNRELSNSSINRAISALRTFFRWMADRGYVKENPMAKILSLKKNRVLPKFVPESRMAQIVDDLCRGEFPTLSRESSFLRRRDALIVLFFYGSGVRLAELVSIDRTDFDSGFENLKVLGKGNKERIVPIIGMLRRKIKEYLAFVDEEKICKSGEKALFLTEKGERINRSEVYRVVRELLTAEGVQGKRSPHVLRHTFATHLLNNGADMREIQELMGHASLQTTQVYTHNSIARLKEVYRAAHPHAGRSKDRPGEYKKDDKDGQGPSKHI